MPELMPAVPGSPEWLAAPGSRPFKLTPWSRIGLIHGAYAAAYAPNRHTSVYSTPYAKSWQYRRGFARAFLAARKAGHA